MAHFHFAPGLRLRVQVVHVGKAAGGEEVVADVADAALHPDLLAFAAAHRYEPRPVAVARGNEKGRVERSIRYIRDNFFAARSFTDVDDLKIGRASCRERV